MEAVLEFIKQHTFFEEMGVKGVFEILILTVLVYYVLDWIRNSQAWGLLKGLLVIFALVLAANVFQLSVITFIAEKSLTILVTALLVIFQPELRNALMQIGAKNTLLKVIRFDKARNQEALYNHTTTEELVKGCRALARTKTGALIVIEREVPLTEYSKTGIEVDARTTGALLINIFEKNTPLHDGAVILKNGRIQAATCYLPLSENHDINKDLGTRHRAAIGISEVTDCVTIVVSEETGAISVAEGGSLRHGLSLEELASALRPLEQEPARTKSRWGRKTSDSNKAEAPQEKEEKHA